MNTAQLKTSSLMRSAKPKTRHFQFAGEHLEAADDRIVDVTATSFMARARLARDDLVDDVTLEHSFRSDGDSRVLPGRTKSLLQPVGISGEIEFHGLE